MPDTMMMEEQGPIGYPITESTKIEQRPDGTYVLDGIYHVAETPEFKEKLAEIEAIAAANPDRVIRLPEPSPEEIERAELEANWESLRFARNGKLAATDYLLMPDYPLGENERAEVIAYRQALRDMPALDGAPWDGGGEQTPWPDCAAVSA